MAPLDNAHSEDDVSHMPDVFVTPPEGPTWHCFDAVNLLLMQAPEPEESILNAFPDNAYYASTAMSVVADAITNQHQEFEDDNETISDYGHELEYDVNSSPRDVANDSDVVEVVKLERHRAAVEPDTIKQQPPAKPPKSLKSRASRALKSFAGSFYAKSKPQDIDSSSSSKFNPPIEVVPPPFPETTARSRTPTTLRRGSGVLSQLFATPVKTRSSMSSFDEPLSSPTSPTYPNFRHSESSGSVKSQPFSSSSSYQTSWQEQARLEASSPTPTTSRRSSRRFSMLSLQKLFSFSSTPSEEATFIPNLHSEGSEVVPVLRSVPSTPAFSSSSSNSGPDTPTSAHHHLPVRVVTSNSSSSSLGDGVPDFPAFDTNHAVFDSNQNLNLGLGLGLDIPISGSSSTGDVGLSTPRKSLSPSTSLSMWGSITPKARKKSTLITHDEADTSLEMKLDSLHFDSLSFDVDRFAIN